MARQSQEPVSLEIFIGGHFGDSFAVRWIGKTIQYSRFHQPGGSNEQTTELSPSDLDWKRFWVALETVGAWQWEARYDLPIADGTHWSVQIDDGKNRLASSGSNAYPPEGDGPVPSSSLERFCTAVSELLNGREFH